MRTRFGLAVFLALVGSATASAQFGQPPSGRVLRFDDVFTKIEARFEPATARRGESVTWILTVELIPGWHTYPTKQVDPNPDAQSYVTKIKAPLGTDVIPVGAIVEPPNPIKKAELDLKIKELHQYEGTVVWKQEMVVNPSAAPGPKTIKIPIKIYACEESCLPPKDIETTATLTVSDAPAVENSKLVKPATTNGNSNGASTASPPTPAVSPEPVNSSDYSAALEALLARISKQKVEPNTDLSAFLLTAAFWGLVTLFTPCVFPMIPITVSFFLKQAEKNHGNALALAFVYCGTIIVMLGIAALTLLQFFTILSINPWMNVFLGALFVVLALSLFGMFDFTLQIGLRAAILGLPLLTVLIVKPAGPQLLWVVGCIAASALALAIVNQWIERAAFQLQQSTANRSSVGGLIGTVFMAISFTIVSFTCVAPFLGGFGGMAASGQFKTWELVLGAFAFSGTFAAPFFLLALFPSLLKKLPKSGGWLNTVKVVMGFLELAAALKFFRTAELIGTPSPNFFTFDLVLGIWIALSVICGLYLINMFRVGHDEPLESVSVPRLLLGTLFIGLALYLMPALFSSGPDGEKQRPRGSVYAWVNAFLLPDASASAKSEGLNWSGDLRAALDAAQNESSSGLGEKLVFIDFTGKSCSNCKLNEENVFTLNEIRDLFRQYKLVQLYTDTVPDQLYASSIRSQFRGSVDRQEADAFANRKFQDRVFGTSQLPLYVILRPSSTGQIEIVGVYNEGKINNVAAFTEFLKKPLSASTARVSKD